MIAWMEVGLAALVVAVVICWALHLRRDRAHWQRRCAAADRTAWQLQDRCEQQQGAVSVAALAGTVAQQLRAPIHVLREHGAEAGGLIQRYRSLVEAYDDAVQYCLQPMDLLPGADAAGLEQLLQYVTDARRRLFAARARVVDSGVPQTLAATLTSGDEAALQLDGLAAALSRFALPADALATVDVNGLLADALLLMQTRLPRGVRVIKRFEILPSLAAAPWLAPTVMQLLQAAAEAADASGDLIVRTRHVGRRIEVHIMGHATVASTEALARKALDTKESVGALQYQLQRHGASLEPMPDDGHGHGFVVHLPVRAEACAA